MYCVLCAVCCVLCAVFAPLHFTSLSPLPLFYQSSIPAASAAAPAADDDDDDDFMASLSDDDEDEDGGAAAQALIAKKNAEREAAKRATKGAPTAKSSLILDIKPEDSETDMNELLQAVKQIEMDGLTWGGHEVSTTSTASTATHY